MTKLSTGEHKAQLEAMKAFDEQMPCVGFFCYDPADKVFLGVYKEKLLCTGWTGDLN